MGANIWPVNAVSGAPSYTGRMLRQTTVAPFTAMGSAARPLGAKSGIRPGTPSSIVAVTSTTWTVQPFAGVLDGEAAAIAGPYGYSFDTAQTGSVTAAGSSARKDRLDVQVSDPAESDGSSVPAIKIVYTQGAATGGAVPAAPARSHALCVINVPASGGGSPTVTWAPEWSGDPGEWTFNTRNEADAYADNIGRGNVPIGQLASVIADSDPKNNLVWVWDVPSTSWVRFPNSQIWPVNLTGIYSAGSPTPQAALQGSTGVLEGVVKSSSATFVSGTEYTIGSISTAVGPLTEHIFACMANATAVFGVKVKTDGTITITPNVTFTGALGLSLNGSWRK
jgi:hypothetical protein